MRRAVIALVGALALACTGGGEEVHWIPGVEIVVDAHLPTTFVASGLPQGRRVYQVGDRIRIVSWPAAMGAADPERARVPGRVVWSVAGRPDAARWEAVDDTLGYLILLEPAPPDDPHMLRAELRPEYHPPPIRSEQ